MVGSNDIARALDPVQLAQAGGFEPDPWQAELLRSDSRQILMLCSRQSGKSTVAGWMASHEVLYRPRSLTLCISPSQRQSGELFRKVKESLIELGEAAPKPAEESALRLEMENRSRVVCLPSSEATVRGFSRVGLVLVDEAARVSDQLYMALRPMVATSGGRIVLLSTSFGMRGFFFREWAEGGDDWQRTRITAYDVPRIDRGWLERERERIGDWWFGQEYLCQFQSATDQVFSYQDVTAAMDSTIAPLFGATPAEEAGICGSAD